MSEKKSCVFNSFSSINRDLSKHASKVVLNVNQNFEVKFSLNFLLSDYGNFASIFKAEHY